MENGELVVADRDRIDEKPACRVGNPHPRRAGHEDHRAGERTGVNAVEREPDELCGRTLTGGRRCREGREAGQADEGEEPQDRISLRLRMNGGEVCPGMIADFTRAINSARGGGVHTPLPAPGVPSQSVRLRSEAGTEVGPTTSRSLPRARRATWSGTARPRKVAP